MSAYLIEVDDSERGVCSPAIVGPFESVAAAEEFSKETNMGTIAQSQGGYSAVHVVSDEACTRTPEQYREDYETAYGVTFVAAGLEVTKPGYATVPFDENLSVFEEGARALLEFELTMTPDSFDDYCRQNAGGPAAVVLPLLDAFREREQGA